MTNHLAVIATNRFGMGARDHEIKEAQSDPQGWLSTHLTPPALDNSLPDSWAVMNQYAEFSSHKGMLKKIRTEARQSECHDGHQ